MSDPVGEFFETFGEASRRLAHSRLEQRIADAHGLDLLAFRLMLHVREEGSRVGDLARQVVAYASHTSRAVGVVGIDDSIQAAEEACERALRHVRGEAIFVRHDIGKADLVNRRVEHMARIRKA